MGLQDFKLKTANTVISSENASLKSMAPDKVFDLLSLNKEDGHNDGDEGEDESKAKSLKQVMENLPELWDESQYEEEHNVETFKEKINKKS